MSEEAIFVAIGIACVVAVLLFIVFIIFCVKKQQDKEQDRQLRQRRAIEERHRRQLMRANIVRPPPYDPNRQNVIPLNHRVIPVSPPPEYKEVATPLPTHRNTAGHGEAAYTPYNGYSSHRDTARAITGNITPVTTVFVGTNYINNNSYAAGNSSNSTNTSNNNNNNSNESGSYINRTTITTTRHGHVSSNTGHIQPQNLATENSEPRSRSSNSYSDNAADYSYDRNRQVNPATGGQRNPSHTITTQELSAAALIRQQNANMNLPINTVSSVKPDRSHQYFNASSGNADNHSYNYASYNSPFGSSRNSNQTQRKTVSEVQTGRSNSLRFTLSGSPAAAQTPRNVLDVNNVAVTPVQISNRGLQNRAAPTRQNTDHLGKGDRISAIEELSLI